MRTPRATEQQVERLLGATSTYAKYWHTGAKTTQLPLADEVMAGSGELNENDLRSLHIPEEYSLDIIEAHVNIISTWSRSNCTPYDPYSTYTVYNSRSGPNVVDALRHRNYKPLENLTPVAWMDFYKSLQVQVAMFNVALMPFKGTHVDVNYAAHGMCYPGLGLRRYMKMGSVLLMILDQVIPK